MRTRSSWIWCWIIGAVLAAPASAAYTTIVENLPTCIGNRNGHIISISDGVDYADCSVGGATGTDRHVVACQCDTLNILGPYWKAVGGSAAPDLSGYVLLNGDVGGQTIFGVSGGATFPRLVLGGTSASLIGAGDLPPSVQLDSSSARLAYVNSIGQTNSVEISEDTFYITLSGTSGLVAISSGAFRVNLPLAIPSADSLPTCNSTLISGSEAKALYIDNTTGNGTLCSCDGSSWSVIAPAGGTCS